LLQRAVGGAAGKIWQRDEFAVLLHEIWYKIHDDTQDMG
jgi:hypothetical protein